MVGLIMGAAVLFAVAVLGLRRWNRWRAEAQRPGATASRAIAVRRFDEIDDALAGRRCRCGDRLRLVGENSTTSGERRLRMVRLECADCGREDRVYFDVTLALH
jgi:hypothetical protein